MDLMNVNVKALLKLHLHHNYLSSIQITRPQFTHGPHECECEGTTVAVSIEHLYKQGLTEASSSP